MTLKFLEYRNKGIKRQFNLGECVKDESSFLIQQLKLTSKV